MTMDGQKSRMGATFKFLVASSLLVRSWQKALESTPPFPWLTYRSACHFVGGGETKGPMVHKENCIPITHLSCPQRLLPLGRKGAYL